MFCVISVERGCQGGSVVAGRLGQDLDNLSSVISRQQRFKRFGAPERCRWNKAKTKLALLASSAIGILNKNNNLLAGSSVTLLKHSKNKGCVRL